MLSVIATPLDAYRPLEHRHKWMLQVLLSFSDRDGKCWPSLRTLAEQAGECLSWVQRNLAEMEALGYFTRRCRAGVSYVYRIADRFLPRWPVPKQVSHRQDTHQSRGQAAPSEVIHAAGCPTGRTEVLEVRPTDPLSTLQVEREDPVNGETPLAAPPDGGQGRGSLAGGEKTPPAVNPGLVHTKAKQYGEAVAAEALRITQSGKPRDAARYFVAMCKRLADPEAQPSPPPTSDDGPPAWLQAMTFEQLYPEYAQAGAAA